MPYMYILECADGTYYTGSTVNLGNLRDVLWPKLMSGEVRVTI